MCAGCFPAGDQTRSRQGGHREAASSRMRAALMPPKMRDGIADREQLAARHADGHGGRFDASRLQHKTDTRLVAGVALEGLDEGAYGAALLVVALAWGAAARGGDRAPPLWVRLASAPEKSRTSWPSLKPRAGSNAISLKYGISSWRVMVTVANSAWMARRRSPSRFWERVAPRPVPKFDSAGPISIDRGNRRRRGHRSYRCRSTRLKRVRSRPRAVFTAMRIDRVCNAGLR